MQPYLFIVVITLSFMFTISEQISENDCRVYFMKKDGNKGFSVTKNRDKPSEVIECEYEYGDSHFHVMVNNPKIDMTKCEVCKCYQTGYMTCCGIGWKAAKPPVPEGCHIKQGENCTYTLVNARDYRLKCGSDVEVNTLSQKDKNSAQKLSALESVVIISVNLLFLLILRKCSL